MTIRKYKFKLKHDPKELLDILKPRAEEEGYSLEGTAKSGKFSAGAFVSGEYKVRGNYLHVTVDCGMPLAWGKVEEAMNDFFDP
jgi:hypothetical protein